MESVMSDKLVEQLAAWIEQAHERPGGREPTLFPKELATFLAPKVTAHTDAAVAQGRLRTLKWFKEFELNTNGRDLRR